MYNKENVLITGGARGIGAETAKLFAESGYNVLINYNNSCIEAENLSKNLNDKGLNTRIFKADVSDRKQVFEMVEFCKSEFGSVDILVNNAGIAQTKLFDEITEPDWDNMLAINLKGVFNCCQAVVKDMIHKKSGKIINISSMWGIAGAACEVHYSAAKAGVIGLTKALAKELGPSNIQVNCVAPGIIKTDMLNEYTEQELKVLKNDTPIGRIGLPKDIANVICFLASKQAEFMTGQVISSNGGFLIY